MPLYHHAALQFETLGEPRHVLPFPYYTSKGGMWKSFDDFTEFSKQNHGLQQGETWILGHIRGECEKEISVIFVLFIS